MPRAVELLEQGRTEELWQMCCGFISLDIEQFMAIQRRLLLEQLDLLNSSALGTRILRGAKPRTVEEFRQWVPLTTYADYCPELLEKREDGLPAKPISWVRTSGRSGEYPCRWIPMTTAFSQEMSAILYGVGMLSSCKERGDASQFPLRPRLVYTVAPRPYISGEMAWLLEQQTPLTYLPALEEAEALPFEDRIKLGLKQALSEGIDYFFGLSLVLVVVGEKFSQSSGKTSLRPLLSRPKALLRLAKGLIKSKLARRPLLPKDLWSVRGIIGSGIDSGVYQDRIKEFWGRRPLDVYATTEGGIIATQTWDYDSMTFIPSLNFLEFVPEQEHIKWRTDRSYQPKTILLDEVNPGEKYEIIITNFHGGALVRYRIGDLIRITSLRNEKAGINLPQMAFESRADDLLNFVVVQLTEKQIWQAIEKTGIAYEDWTASKVPGEQVLRLLIETKGDFQGDEADIAAAVEKQILHPDNNGKITSGVLDDLTDMIDFRVEAMLLPDGAFANYKSQRLAEGADLAHLKPPHINPSEKVLTLLLGKPEAVPPARVNTEAERVTTG